MKFKTVLDKILTTEGRTQTWLAKKIGAAPNQVNDWASGKHIPNDDYKRKIANALNRSVEEIFFTNCVSQLEISPQGARCAQASRKTTA